MELETRFHWQMDIQAGCFLFENLTFRKLSPKESLEIHGKLGDVVLTVFPYSIGCLKSSVVRSAIVANALRDYYPSRQ